MSVCRLALCSWRTCVKRWCHDPLRVSSVPSLDFRPGIANGKSSWLQHGSSLGNLNFQLQSSLCGPVSWLEVLDSLTLPCSGAGSAPGSCPGLGTERPGGPRAGTLHVTRSKSLKPPVPRSLPLQSGANDSYLSAPTVLNEGKAAPFSMYLCMLHTIHIHVTTASCLFQIKTPESGMER